MTDAPQQPTAQLTDDERKTLRSAAILAGAMVSRAEKGFFDTFKESFAASKAVKDAPADIQQLVLTGGMPEMPTGSPEETEARTLELLRSAASVLRSKAPHLLEGYRATVVQSARDVAAAADDTSANESGAITKIEQALAG
jgi:hypothetical protein